jgi:hypothetical protein
MQALCGFFGALGARLVASGYRVLLSAEGDLNEYAPMRTREFDGLVLGWACGESLK